VQPEIIRLPLTDNDYIDVKAELNAGESRKVWADMVRDGVKPGEPTILDPERVGLTRMLAYLVGWSFVDADGRPVPVSEAAILNLTRDSFREIFDVIDEHEIVQDRRREERRRDPTIATGLRAIS